jgi:hypothetical protein
MTVRKIARVKSVDRIQRIDGIAGCGCAEIVGWDSKMVLFDLRECCYVKENEGEYKFLGSSPHGVKAAPGDLIVCGTELKTSYKGVAALKVYLWGFKYLDPENR